MTNRRTVSTDQKLRLSDEPLAQTDGWGLRQGRSAYDGERAGRQNESGYPGMQCRTPLAATPGQRASSCAIPRCSCSTGNMLRAQVRSLSLSPPSEYRWNSETASRWADT